jgi:hypothetical protein
VDVKPAHRLSKPEVAANASHRNCSIREKNWWLMTVRPRESEHIMVPENEMSGASPQPPGGVVSSSSAVGASAVLSAR